LETEAEITGDFVPISFKSTDGSAIENSPKALRTIETKIET
jgi:hypothetical protein